MGNAAFRDLHTPAELAPDPTDTLLSLTGADAGGSDAGGGYQRVPGGGGGAGGGADLPDGTEGGGAPLPAAILAKMGGALGSDLSAVRIHKGPEADAAAKRVRALAFTRGTHIYFRNGAFAPGTASGDRLLAHELQHVVQAQSGPAPSANGVASPDSANEVEADQVADAIVQGKQPQSSTTSAPMTPITGGPIHRKTDPAVATAPQADPPTQTNAAPKSPAPYRPPTPVAPDGNLGYYNARNKDFVNRYKDVPELAPPDYYLSYGAKYADRFSNETANRLTDDGKAWLVRARINLQVAIEQRLNGGPAAFDALEKNQDAFRDFAFSTHADAYWTAGLGDLGPADLANIALTPDVRDLLSKSGLLQVDDIGGRLLNELRCDIVDLIAGEGTADKVKATSLNLYEGAKEELDLKCGKGTAEKLEDIITKIDNVASDIKMATFDAIYAVESKIIETEASVIDSILGEPHDPNHPERHGPLERGADKLRNKLQDFADWVEEKL